MRHWAVPSRWPAGRLCGACTACHCRLRQCMWPVTVNVTQLPAVSYDILDKSGQVALPAEGVNHVETPLSQLQAPHRVSSCAKRKSHATVSKSHGDTRNEGHMDPNSCAGGLCAYHVFRMRSVLIMSWGHRAGAASTQHVNVIWMRGHAIATRSGCPWWCALGAHSLFALPAGDCAL